MGNIPSSPSGRATPEPSQVEDVMSVAAARQLSKGASAMVRGVVTLAPGLVDPTMAALQDTQNLILLVSGAEKWNLCKEILAGGKQDTPLAMLIKKAGALLTLHIAEV